MPWRHFLFKNKWLGLSNSQTMVGYVGYRKTVTLEQLSKNHIISLLPFTIYKYFQYAYTTSRLYNDIMPVMLLQKQQI